MAKRLQLMGVKRYHDGFGITLHEDLINAPLMWKKPRRIFVNSMSDLFHEQVPLEFIQRVFVTMSKCPQHTFQILTKRSKRLLELSPELTWPDNVWMGVTVEDSNVIDRIFDLAGVPAAIHFLSCEPLIGPLNYLPLENIQWVIVGGESGPGARLMRKEWVETVYIQCRKAGVPFFFKQWGGTRKNKTGRLLDNRVYDEMPSLMYQPSFVA
jgi:protein gp37